MALIILWAKYDGPLSKDFALVDAGFRLADAIVLGSLSYLEHNRAIRPSDVICLYLFLSLLFDAAQCRTLWLIGETSSLGPVFLTGLSLKIVLFLLESKEKGGILLDNHKTDSKEATANVFNRIFFWWVNGLLIRGYSSVLKAGSLEDIGDDLSSELLLRKFQACWEKYSTTRFPKHRLLFTLIDALKAPILNAIVPRLFMLGFSVTLPLLLNRTIRFVQEERGTDLYSTYVGYGLIGAVAVVSFGQAVSLTSPPRIEPE